MSPDRWFANKLPEALLKFALSNTQTTYTGELDTSKSMTLTITGP